MKNVVNIVGLTKTVDMEVFEGKIDLHITDEPIIDDYIVNNYIVA